MLITQTPLLYAYNCIIEKPVHIWYVHVGNMHIRNPVLILALTTYKINKRFFQGSSPSISFYHRYRILSLPLQLPCRISLRFPQFCSRKLQRRVSSDRPRSIMGGCVDGFPFFDKVLENRLGERTILFANSPILSYADMI